MAAARAVLIVKQHVPLIKFPNREGLCQSNQRKGLGSVLGMQSPGQPPDPHQPTGNSYSIESNSALPLRFHRKPIDPEEMAFIERGGPE
uniref:alpha-ketoglutarate dehydrogenase component 4 isoform X1 n=1 Tax=Myxine glutinosa TaxID=7769 RepID=UPI00358E09BB